VSRGAGLEVWRDRADRAGALSRELAPSSKVRAKRICKASNRSGTSTLPSRVDRAHSSEMAELAWFAFINSATSLVRERQPGLKVVSRE
jgi:hypothetical protein